jgi:CRISPR-associated endonuclease/helicase Cas3
MQEQGEPLCLVSTQIIEAGVDLSFGHIVRALSVLPSIAQSAGRVNRHFEKELGLLSLILFLREGKRDTRKYVYPSSLLKLTDQLLSQKRIWIESEINNLIKVYYIKMFEHNSFEAGKQAIADAYEGDWPNLSSFKPFGEDYLKLPVFVPWKAYWEYEKYLPPKFVELQNRLGINSPESLYQYYEDSNYYSKLSFEKKKEFMILFNHYVVNVPAKLAVSIVDKELYMENRIPILLNVEDYDSNTGLAKRFMEGFDNII